MEAGRMNPDGESLTLAGSVIGLITTMLFFGLGGVMIARLLMGIAGAGH
jgi:hypothetical protein